VRKNNSSAQQGKCEKKIQTHSRISAKKKFKGTAGSVRKKNSSIELQHGSAKKGNSSAQQGKCEKKFKRIAGLSAKKN